MGLDGYSKRQIRELSGGEFQRLLIARAVYNSPEILILDEPTANIDAAFENSIFSTRGHWPLEQHRFIISITC